MSAAVALYPKVLATHSSNPNGKHVIEIFYDFVCPYCKKMFQTLEPVIEKLESTNQFNFVFRHQLQPWHPSSIACAEVALAVAESLEGEPEDLIRKSFWEYSRVLFAESRSFYDEAVYNDTRYQTWENLVELVDQCKVGKYDKNKILSLLEIPVVPGAKPANAGNKITNLIKSVSKYGRDHKVHVSPTVVVDGVVQDDIESSFTAEQWLKRLQEIASK